MASAEQELVLQDECVNTHNQCLKTSITNLVLVDWCCQVVRLVQALALTLLAVGAREKASRQQ
jgi:hypothetical protein